MARQGRLTARKVETAKPGKYEDGNGLRLVVSTTGARKWVYRYMLAGKRSEMGLGSMPTVGLSKAREKAADTRRLAKQGQDPVAARRAAKSAGRAPTFGEMADALIESIEHGFRNAKHRYQWRQTLTEYAKPLRAKTVDAITTEDVLECLKPIWQTKAETASRLRGRIERVLDAAKAKDIGLVKTRPDGAAT